MVTFFYRYYNRVLPYESIFEDEGRVRLLSQVFGITFITKSYRAPVSSSTTSRTCCKTRDSDNLDTVIKCLFFKSVPKFQLRYKELSNLFINISSSKYNKYIIHCTTINQIKYKIKYILFLHLQARKKTAPDIAV